MEFSFVPESADGILHLSVLMKLAPECADNSCGLHLHRSVLTNLAPESADGILDLSVLTNLAPECADNLSSLNLHLCVLTTYVVCVCICAGAC